jgi:outer membrane protein OmpA-like peptidoglycan-associated protein
MICGVNKTILVFIFSLVLFKPHAQCQPETDNKKQLVYADTLVKAFFKNGYTKGNSDIPPEYRKVSEKKSFFGGKGFSYIQNINPDLVLGDNDYYVNIPKGSFLIVGFKNGIELNPEGNDLFIQGCQCSCGKKGIDSVMVSVSYNNKIYHKVGIAHDGVITGFDLKNISTSRRFRYVKIEGLSAVEHQYGYELMKVWSLSCVSSPVIETENDSFLKNEGKSITPATPFLIKKLSLRDVFFNLNDSTLNENEVTSLDSVIHDLSEKKIVEIRVSGYTDTRGADKFNYILSLGRARAVARMLEESGIDKRVIKVTGYGETRLLNPDDGEAPENRRVEIEIKYESIKTDSDTLIEPPENPVDKQ